MLAVMLETTHKKQTITKLKTANWTISTLIILTNIYFLPFSFVTLKSTDEPILKQALDLHAQKLRELKQKNQ